MENLTHIHYQLSVDAPSQLPEPDSVALLGLGLAGLVAARRKVKAKAKA